MQIITHISGAKYEREIEDEENSLSEEKKTKVKCGTQVSGNNQDTTIARDNRTSQVPTRELENS